ncbi:hypothetical protein [Vulcanisaeta distributa]|uniref:PIN domain-containing protein n=1 Tax=Vulcanisaeta distributa (strain DSM 14429 / JCM 11212 / NBRC 100878 / IC-017) TaxID=572478 RepID=E1QNS7_VULDI|nr:hypothetical protein [Vulcanisaeta distributa]ADN50173.1 hypothetical protein Vdis_0781 [Vulcanisaeta distributa DSM 14429]
MVFEAFHIFVDTNVLVKIIYTMTLHRKLNKPKIKILDLLENRTLVIYTDSAIIRELKNVALHNLLSNVDRAKHGWHNVEVNVMEQYCINQLNDMVSKGYIRIIEDDESLKIQREALRYRPKRRVCWKNEIMDQLLSKIPSEDIDIVNSLLYAYDLLATVPRRKGPGITSGKLIFITEDKNLRDFVEGHLACNKCPCANKIITLNYREFKEQLTNIGPRDNK